MHHPLDVAGGVLVGLEAIAVVVFACRAAMAATEIRSVLIWTRPGFVDWIGVSRASLVNGQAIRIESPPGGPF